MVQAINQVRNINRINLHLPLERSSYNERPTIRNEPNRDHNGIWYHSNELEEDS